MSLISVIIPVYNMERYLSRCIDSIIAQTHRDYECILINDGSTDSSPRLCEEYERKDNRIRVIHKENGGLSSARNTGIDNSRGNYIFFLDSDDFVPDYSLETLYSNIGTADICAGNVYTFSGDYFSIKNSDKISIKNYTKQVALKNILLIKPPYTYAWGKLYKKELFNNLQYANCLYEDIDLIYKLIDRCVEIRCVNRICYCYNLGNTTSITASRYTHAHFSAIENAYKMMDFVVKTYSKYGWAAKYYFCQTNFHIYKRMLLSVNIPAEDKKEVKYNIRRYMLFALCNINTLGNSFAKIILFLLGEKIAGYFYRYLSK
jgi:glycosyltransferase involved in cell wall biosynthesis